MSTTEEFGLVTGDGKSSPEKSRDEQAQLPQHLRDERQLDENLARRFQLRAIELAKQGVFGALKTRKASLQNAYSLVLSLLDSPAVPFLIYGETGSGKRRHVAEYLVIHNFFRKLKGQSTGQLKVFRGDFVSPGFTAQLRNPFTQGGDIVYLEAVDRLEPECQNELREHLLLRKKLAQSGVEVPRIIVGTDRAVSILVLQKVFDRALFQALTSFALFLPSLNERPEDMPLLIQAFTEDLTHQTQTPPTWLVDHFSHLIWPENLEGLKKVLKEGLSKKNNIEAWTPEDLPASLQPKESSNFQSSRPKDMSKEHNERKTIRQALMSCGGNRLAAAEKLGMDKSEFLSKLLWTGLR